MNLRDLHYLVTVAETLHFAKAAELCHVSQPTLSMQLKKLEEELGLPFFERTNKKVLLTEQGRLLVDQARRILKEAQQLRELAQFAADPFAGSLSLGCIPTLAPYLLPHIIPKIKKELPKLQLSLREDKTDSLLEQLNAGKLDAAILALPIETHDFKVQPLFNEHFWVLMPATHPLAQHSKIDLKELKDQNMLLLADGHCLREQALAVCQKAHSQQRSDFAATSLETLRQMVALGSGITLLPALAVQGPFAHSPLIAARAFKDPSPSRHIALIWRKSATQQACLEKLAESIKAVKLPL